MKWLITGGCGFIGTNLLARLAEEGGHAVRILDSLAVGTRADLRRVSEFQELSGADLGPHGPPGSVQLVVGDILDSELCLRVVGDSDVIVVMYGCYGLRCIVCCVGVIDVIGVFAWKPMD